MNGFAGSQVKDSRPPSSRMKTTDYQRGKNLGSLMEIIRGEGASQPQSIGDEIIRPRDRATQRL